MDNEPQTWHHGLVAEYWREFNVGGPEIPYYQDLIERSGQPALDVGCGTGRLLLPYRRAGIDIDGSDISADMLSLCEQSAKTEGLSVNLYEQAMHDLDLPRKYQTILVSGAFELSGDRQHALEALKRLRDHLGPGGVLALDHHPVNHGRAWQMYKKQQLPAAWSTPENKRFSDGSEYVMRIRLVDFDPLEQCITREIRVELHRDDKVVAEEQYTLNEWIHSKNEILTMLELTGFGDITVQGDYTDMEASVEHEAIVFVAHM